MSEKVLGFLKKDAEEVFGKSIRLDLDDKLTAYIKKKGMKLVPVVSVSQHNDDLAVLVNENKALNEKWVAWLEKWCKENGYYYVGEELLQSSGLKYIKGMEPRMIYVDIEDLLSAVKKEVGK